MWTFFALRGGSELRSLQWQQITVEELSSGEKYLLYKEMGSKNNPGGIGHRRVYNKEVPHIQNKDNPDRDFVSLYQKHISKFPPECNEFFLQTLKNRQKSNGVVGHSIGRSCETVVQ